MAAKEAAAQLAFSEFVKRHAERVEAATPQTPFVLGVGSGTTIVAFMRQIAARFGRSKSAGASLVCVPSSQQARFLIVEEGLVLGDLLQHPCVNVAVDGADELDSALNIIKGGGAAHVAEKIVIEAAASVIIIADDTKYNGTGPLGQKARPIPIEVIPMAVESVKRQLRAAFSHCHVKVRECSGGKIGPVISDNGNLILDLHLPLDSAAWLDLAATETRIVKIAGVVGTGLFVSSAASPAASVIAVIGCDNGTATVIERAP